MDGDATRKIGREASANSTALARKMVGDSPSPIVGHLESDSLAVVYCDASCNKGQPVQLVRRSGGDRQELKREMGSGERATCHRKETESKRKPLARMRLWDLDIALVSA